MARGFWFSRWAGSGTQTDPFIPEVVQTALVDFPGLRWRTIDLRSNPDQGTGWCIVGTSRARLTWENKPRVWGLGTSWDSVLPDDFVDAVNAQYGRSYPYGRTVRDFVRYALRRAPVANPIRPGRDGRFRVYLDAGEATQVGSGVSVRRNIDAIDLGSALAVGTPVGVAASTAGGLPNGRYFVAESDGRYISVSTTPGGPVVNVTSNGTCDVWIENIVAVADEFTEVDEPVEG